MDRKEGLKEARVAREGYKFIIPSFIFFILFVFLHYYPLASLSLSFFFFCLFFFRNPPRFSEASADCLVSPADGKVVAVKDMVEGEFLGSDATRVSIFMSLASVHVNRSPLDGRIVRMEHRPGNFKLAWKGEVDTENERNYILMESNNERFLVVQIAGFVARRITPYVHEGDMVKRTDPLGIIAFGSRVDIYLPKTYECMVQLHDSLKAGTTVVAKRKEKG